HVAAGGALVVAAGVQGAGAGGGLQPQLLGGEVRGGQSPRAGPRQPVGDGADRGQVRPQALVFGRSYGGNGERGGPPAFAPGQQQAGTVQAQGVALAERGQLGAVGAGLGAQLAGAERGAVLVEHVEAAPARPHQPGPVVVGLGA